MASTTRTSRNLVADDSTPPPLRWRSWPLIDHPNWSWLSVAALVAVGGLVWWLGGGWLLGALAMLGLAATFWQVFVPVEYEISSAGIRRHALQGTKLLPWHSVRAFQTRASGIVMFQRSDPSPVDVLRSVYVPYPENASELMQAVRPHLSHAVELPAETGEA